MTERTAGSRLGRGPAEADPVVLIVDDDIAAGTAMARMLDAQGYHVVCAAGCRSARAVISALPVDLVITDLFMPGMHGLALLELIRKRRFGIPVIVKSDPRWRGAFDLAALARRLGAVATLSVPISRPRLVETLSELFGDVVVAPAFSLASAA